uniref:Uncharacterized protein n=1 Tax=Bursaphelenchus xylophilus TaxID=6326 RepID=A0A1I7SR94_BURXY
MFSLRFFLRKSESFGREGALKGPGAQFPRRPPGSIPPLAGGGKNGKKRRKGWRLLTQPTVTTPPTPLNSNLRHDLLPSGRTTTTRSVEVNKPFPRQKAAESLQVTLSVAFRGGATAPSASQNGTPSPFRPESRAKALRRPSKCSAEANVEATQVTTTQGGAPTSSSDPHSPEFLQN